MNTSEIFVLFIEIWLALFICSIGFNFRDYNIVDNETTVVFGMIVFHLSITAIVFILYDEDLIQIIFSS